MNNIDVSVIVPVYNVETRYLRECIESVLGQSLKSTELVLISDGAGDAQISLMREYEKDERVQIVFQDNQGVSVARNAGIAAARGKYITFVDSDDYIDKDMCKEALDAILARDCQVLLWGSYKFDDKGIEKYMPYNEDIKCFDDKGKKNLQLKTMSGVLPIFGAEATKFGSGSACSKMYSKAFLIENDLEFPAGVKRAEDVNFHIRVFEAADKISYLNRNFYYYRQNEDSATYQYREGGISVFTEALNCLWDFIKDKDKDFKEVFYMRCMFFLLESMDMDYLNKNNPKSFNVRASELKAAINSDPYKTAIDNMDGRFLSLAKRIPYYLIKFGCVRVLMVFYSIYKRLGG